MATRTCRRRRDVTSSLHSITPVAAAWLTFGPFTNCTFKLQSTVSRAFCRRTWKKSWIEIYLYLKTVAKINHHLIFVNKTEKWNGMHWMQWYSMSCGYSYILLYENTFTAVRFCIDKRSIVDYAIVTSIPEIHSSLDRAVTGLFHGVINTRISRHCCWGRSAWLARAGLKKQSSPITQYISWYSFPGRVS